MDNVTEPAFTCIQLTRRYHEQQLTIDELERKLIVVTTLLDDLKRADDEHSAQTLLIKDPNWALDEDSDRCRHSSCSFFFCC